MRLCVSVSRPRWEKIHPRPPLVTTSHHELFALGNLLLSSNSKCGNTAYDVKMVNKLEDQSVVAFSSDSQALYLYLQFLPFGQAFVSVSVANSGESTKSRDDRHGAGSRSSRSYLVPAVAIVKSSAVSPPRVVRPPMPVKGVSTDDSSRLWSIFTEALIEASTSMPTN